jgi:hypothetical protein
VVDRRRLPHAGNEDRAAVDRRGEEPVRVGAAAKEIAPFGPKMSVGMVRAECH